MRASADWAAIAAVKAALKSPSSPTATATRPQAAQQMLRLSGADAVMIGRAAQGRPWLVGDVAHLSRNRPPAARASLSPSASRSRSSISTPFSRRWGRSPACATPASILPPMSTAPASARAIRLAACAARETDPDEARRLWPRLFSTPPRRGRGMTTEESRARDARGQRHARGCAFRAGAVAPAFSRRCRTPIFTVRRRRHDRRRQRRRRGLFRDVEADPDRRGARQDPAFRLFAADARSPRCANAARRSTNIKLISGALRRASGASTRIALPCPGIGRMFSSCCRNEQLLKK